MQVQDVAEFNSTYFNYMVASQESEPGEGWDYDVWLKKLANNVDIDTKSLLSSVADSFISKCAASYNSYGGEYVGYNDGTMSVLDLSKIGEYKNSFERVAKYLYSDVTTKSKFKTLMNKCNQFGYVYEDDYNGYYAFDVFDVGDFISAVNTTYSDIDTTSLKEKLNDLVIYNVYGKNNYPSGTRKTLSGLSMFAAVNGVSTKSDYSLSQTNFEEWRLLNNNVGTWHLGY